MLDGLLHRFAALLRGEDRTDGEEAEGDASRFLPSVLDASVRYAHGQNNSAGEREIAKISDEAARREERLRRK